MIDDEQELLKRREDLEYNYPTSPEVVTSTWQARWKNWGERVGLNIIVPDCDWTEKEIKASWVERGRRKVPTMMVYKPGQIIGKEGLVLLGRIFPEMASYSVREDTPIKHDYQSTGWVKVEAIVDAPYRNTNQNQLEDFFASQGRSGQTLDTYIIASEANKEETGLYFDEGDQRGVNWTWARLLGSHQRGDVVAAGFSRNGYLEIHWSLYSQDRLRYMGGRSEQVRS